MQSSFCPKCKKYLTPDIVKCPSCGFDRKKYYEENFYAPKTNPATFANHSLTPLNGFWKARIFVFPPGFLLIFLFGNNRQRQESLKFFSFGFAFYLLLALFLSLFVFHLTF